VISNQVRIYSRFVINKNRVINFHNSHQHLPGMMYSNSIVTPNKITWKIISTSVHLDADVHKKNVITPIAGIVRRCSVTTQVCINSYDALPLSHGLIESLITILQIGQKKNRAPWRIAWFVELPETADRIRNFLYVAKGEKSMYNNLQKFTK